MFLFDPDISNPQEMFLGKRVLRKYVANLQENTHAEVWF